MKERLVWIDLETTGLDPARGYPLEVAVMLTDQELNIVGQYQAVVGWGKELEKVLAAMGPYVREMHEKNGLVEELRRPDLRTKEEIHAEAVSWLLNLEVDADHWAPPRLAGSKPEFDRQWMRQWFPTLARLPHYRDFDLSTVRSLFRLPKGYGEVEGGLRHRVLVDLAHDLRVLKDIMYVLGYTEVDLERTGYKGNVFGAFEGPKENK